MSRILAVAWLVVCGLCTALYASGYTVPTLPNPTVHSGTFLADPDKLTGGLASEIAAQLGAIEDNSKVRQVSCYERTCTPNDVLSG